jgi:alanyl-tRNA synthetase
VVSGLSLERLAFVVQKAKSIFEIDLYSSLFSTIQTYGFTSLQTKKLIALLVPLFYVISEGNLPTRRGKHGDLRLLFTDVFATYYEGDGFSWLHCLASHKKLISKRNELFKVMDGKQQIFFIEMYEKILSLFNPIYDTLEGKYRDILAIIGREKEIFLERSFANQELSH